MRRQAAADRNGWPGDRVPPAFAFSRRPVHEPGPYGHGQLTKLLVVVATILVLVASAKPWGETSLPVSGGSVMGDLIADALPAATPRPAPAARFVAPALATGDLAAAELCRWPSGWRVFADQRWSDREVRSWTAVQPVRASRPIDAEIPLVRLASGVVPLLGFCAPAAGSSASPSAAPPAVSIWRLEDEGPPVPVQVARVEPVAASALGALWAPLDGTRPIVAWPPGRYVFRLAGVDGAGAATEAWWSVEVAGSTS